MLKHVALKHVAPFLILSSGLAFALPSRATVIFSDNFDANPSLFGYTPDGWTITNGGTVDTGVGGFGIYVELGGNTNKPGQLTKTLNLTGGLFYRLDYALMGSTVNASDTVNVAFGTINTTHTVLKNAPYTTYNLVFKPSVTGNYDFSFLNGGTNNEGAQLIIATVSQAPGPLPILGIAAVFGFSRKLRSRIKNAKPELISTTAV